jgi:hypothetical protein
LVAFADTYPKVRATRAYVAGFGTSGSLLAGAALMFLLASAIVGFHGWPQVGSPNSVANVLAPNVTVAPSSPASRILAAITAGRIQSASARALPAGGGGHGPRGGMIGSPQASSPAALSVGLHAASATGCSGSKCTPSIPSTPTPTQVTKQLSTAVAQTGAKVGKSVSTTATKAATVVAPVSPAASSTLKKLGHGAAHAVSSTSTSAATQVQASSSLLGAITKH